MQARTRELYASSNGDKWFLRHDAESGRIYVKHVANPASGGHQTDYQIHAFRNRAPTPERDALLKLIASLAEDESEPGGSS